MFLLSAAFVLPGKPGHYTPGPAGTVSPVGFKGSTPEDAPVGGATVCPVPLPGPADGPAEDGADVVGSWTGAVAVGWLSTISPSDDGEPELSEALPLSPGSTGSTVVTPSSPSAEEPDSPSAPDVVI